MPKGRIRVAVLMGGISSEHLVSLKSGCGILNSLDPENYAGFPVLISKENEWIWPVVQSDGVPVVGATRGSLLQPEQAQVWLENPPADWNQAKFPRFTKFPEADIFFIGLHGVGGEDGRLQGFLEMSGQAYTGSGSTGSAIAMDKILSKRIYEQAGIPTSKWVELNAKEFGKAGVEKVLLSIGLPAVVKHPSGGSSLGVAIVRDEAELIRALVEIGKNSPRLLVEAFISGREATCGVLEGGPKLPPTEIRPKKGGFFSYEAKYGGDVEEITPAGFPSEVLVEIQNLAVQCHQALGLKVYSRTDVIWTGTEILVLETNNLPGFTPASILPQQAAAIGISFQELITRIIEESRTRWRAL